MSINDINKANRLLLPNRNQLKNQLKSICQVKLGKSFDCQSLTWLIDFNYLPTCQRLFYAFSLRNRVHTYIFVYLILFCRRSYEMQIVFLNRSIWPRGGILTGTTTSSKNGPKSNGVVYRGEGRTTTHNIYTSFYSFQRGQISVVWERQTEREKDEDGLLDWSIASSSLLFSTHAVLFSRPHLALLLLGRVGSQPEAAVGRQDSGVLSHILQLTRTITWRSAYIISWRLRLAINHMTASAYLHRCVLFREISDWRFGQGSIYKNGYEEILRIPLIAITETSPSNLILCHMQDTKWVFYVFNFNRKFHSVMVNNAVSLINYNWVVR